MDCRLKMDLALECSVRGIHTHQLAPLENSFCARCCIQNLANKIALTHHLMETEDLTSHALEIYVMRTLDDMNAITVGKGIPRVISRLL